MFLSFDVVIAECSRTRELHPTDIYVNNHLSERGGYFEQECLFVGGQKTVHSGNQAGIVKETALEAKSCNVDNQEVLLEAVHFVIPGPDDKHSHVCVL